MGMQTTRLAVLLVALVNGDALAADASKQGVQVSGDGTDEYGAVVRATRDVAVEQPIAGYPQLSSHLAFEPRVDLQSRNIAEAQGDVSVRGGIFENTGVNLGAVTLFDPQTGHYLTELPLPPAMLSAPEIRVGFDNAFTGFNSSVATLAYAWKPIRPGGRLSLDVGSGGGNHQSLYLAHGGTAEDGTGVAADVDLARAAGDGTVRDADYRFERLAARVQVTTSDDQTDLFAGLQRARYAWPYLYAVRELHDLVGSRGAESDDMRTVLVAANHVWQDERTRLEFSAYYRDHESDYEFDRQQPGLFNPFEHRTRLWALGASARRQLAGVVASARAQLLQDRIESTALTFGDVHTRTYVKLAFAAESSWRLGGDWSLQARGGATFDDSDHDDAAGAPIVEVAVESGGAVEQRYFAQASRATQVPGYTAIASNPDAGLFRGNQSLGRERSDNLEAGGAWRIGRLGLQASVFHRRDDDLVDWTYSRHVTPFAARTANNVDIRTTGVEVLMRGRWSWLRWVVGYTWLAKTEEYGLEDVDASFYALNYPRHRATVALIAKPHPSLELRADHELRDQAPNALRHGRTRVALGSARVIYKSPHLRGLVVTCGVDNLYNLGFQEIPGVPGNRRRIGLGVGYIF